MASATREQPNHPTLEPILGAIADWVKKYRYAAGLRNELAQCGPEEVAHTARELGLSSRDLYRIARKGPNAADLLQKMLLALGVSPQKLASEDPLIMRDLQRASMSWPPEQRARISATFVRTRLRSKHC